MKPVWEPHVYTQGCLAGFRIWRKGWEIAARCLEFQLLFDFVFGPHRLVGRLQRHRPHVDPLLVESRLRTGHCWAIDSLVWPPHPTIVPHGNPPTLTAYHSGARLAKC